ncbi:PDZ domain-containing protein [Leptolyngbya sp. 7M]|uniref:PDZ domain-containing protein n=1 Tax=Leptolyngbya sp. 7M TaxID=2812896 RepID=UPI001B8BB491|nr:PDZ domain-containing protein [Leptolyngbya sp. 7M]QYO68936.1 hypothetical protein JVX88_15365 [Leptolyngbya sp. 7M]
MTIVRAVGKTNAGAGENQQTSNPEGRRFFALEGGRWEVKGLAGGSIAERSGIQKGDVIVSIGERNVGSAQTIESGRIADSITVKRDNQQKDIRLIRP